MSRVYLVPHDFTPIGDVATRHALALARQTKAEVHLYHITKDKAENAKAIEKLNSIVDNLKLNKVFDPKFQVHADTGDIFVDIAKMGKKLDASLIVMGTHGAVGVSQKLFGSFAIKVITSCDIPFVIVQDQVPAEKISTIVMAIDLSLESMQVLNIAADLAAWFNAEIHLVAPKEKDPGYARKIAIRIELIKKNLDQRKIKCQVNLMKGSGGLHNQVIEYGKSVKADMFAIAYHSESLLPQFDKFAQTIITNELKLPAMIVNSKAATSGYF